MELQPMVGFGRYMTRIQTPNNSGIFSITNSHDLCLAAYSRLRNNNLQNGGDLGPALACMTFGISSTFRNYQM